MEYVAGEVGGDDPSYSPAELASIGRLLHDFHDAVATFTPAQLARWNQVIPAGRPELICHGDPAPWNIVRAPRRWVLIDWDFAGPGTALWELAHAAQTAAIPQPDTDFGSAARRLKAVVDGYGLDEGLRRELVTLLPDRGR